MGTSSLFWILALAIVAATLALLLVPLLRRAASTPAPGDDDAATAIYRDHKRQLDAELGAGAICATEHATALAELTQRFGAELESSATSSTTAARRDGVAAALVLVALVPVTAGVLYFALGAPAALTPTVSRPEATDAGQVAAMVDDLAARLKANPDDGEGWALLGRAYRVLDRYPASAAAFAEAVKRLPPNASLLVDWAEALAQVQGRSLAGQPTQLLERALALEPDSAKALALAGAAAMERGDRSQAIVLWSRLRDVLPPDSPQLAQIETALASAGVTLPAPAHSATRGSVSGRVEIDPKVAGNIKPTDTVFIFARDPDGPRAPLAALKIAAGQLPHAFELTDAMAMTPEAVVSRAKKLVVEARVSRSGDAKAAAGDLAGTSAIIAPGARDVVVRIDRVLP